MTSISLKRSVLSAACATAVVGSLVPAAAAQSQPDARDTVVVTGTKMSPETQKAIAEIERTAGGVEYVPGVIVQPRMGDDAGVSIRGSGLSRPYGSRGISMYYDKRTQSDR